MKWLRRGSDGSLGAPTLTAGKIYPVIGYEYDEIPVTIDDNGNKFTCYGYKNLELWEVVDEVVEENQTAQLGRNN